MKLKSKTIKKSNKVLVIAKKEMKEILSAKRTLIISFVFAAWFGFTYGQSLGAGLSAEVVTYIFTITLAAFLSFILSSQIFLREKFEKTIIDLLCTPLTVEQILTGKVLGISIFVYGFDLLSLIIFFITRYYNSGSFPSISLPILFNIFINIPLFIGFAVCLNGLIQLLLGIKENRVAYFIVYIIVFGAAFSVNKFVAGNYNIGWPIIIITFAVICILFLILFFLTHIASKEKIITKID